jgi:hypothetical protein
MFQKSGKDKNGNPKFRGDCKTCVKAYYESNKTRISNHRKERRKNNDSVREYHRNYHNAHKDKMHVLQKQYRDTHKLQESTRKKLFYKNNPDKKFVKYCRNRIAHIFKTGKGVNELLNCDPEFLQEWIVFNIEREENMTLENYGTYWHIDHVIPCATWDVTDEEQKKKCFSWTNLAPLEADVNIAKGSKIIRAQVLKHERRLKEFMKHVITVSWP